MCKKFPGILATILLLAPCSLFGQESTPATDDFGSWASVQATASVNKFYLTLRGEHRSNQSMSNTECWFISANAGYKFTDWLKAEMGYERWDISRKITDKAVLIVYGTLKQGNLSATLREKYELAFTPDGSANSTLRSKLKTQYAIPNCAFKPYLAAEIYAWSSWKKSLYFVGTDISVSKRSSFDVFYVYSVPKGGRCTHIIGIGYNFSFSLKK